MFFLSVHLSLSEGYTYEVKKTSPSRLYSRKAPFRVYIIDGRTGANSNVLPVAIPGMLDFTVSISAGVG